MRFTRAIEPKGLRESGILTASHDIQNGLFFGSPFVFAQKVLTKEEIKYIMKGVF